MEPQVAEIMMLIEADGAAVCGSGTPGRPRWLSTAGCRPGTAANSPAPATRETEGPR